MTVARMDGMDFNTVAPIHTIQEHHGRPVMIVHGGQDEWVNVRSAYRLYQASGEQADLWIVEDARHVEAMFLYPLEYTDRLVAFFSAALGP